MVLSPERVACRHERAEWEIYKQIWAMAAVMQMLYRYVVHERAERKREPSPMITMIMWKKMDGWMDLQLLQVLDSA